jgi:hypothetical protein
MDGANIARVSKALADETRLLIFEAIELVAALIATRHAAAQDPVI